MAESSYLWTTGGAGDGAAPYTRSDWSVISRILGWGNGIVSGFLNSFSHSVVSANIFRVNTGGAIVDGKPYYNSTSLDVNVPSPIGAGNARIDRVVLRADWSTQTVRIHRIEGTDPGANPTTPPFVQNSGTTWDLPLYNFRIDSVGSITNVNDERIYIQIPTNALADAVVTVNKLAADSVDNTKLRNSTGMSVIGRAASSNGDPADIVAGVDGTVLRRSGGTLGFGTIGTNGIADNAIVEAKISGFAVTNGKIASNAVDDLKVGNRVPVLTRRRGGSPTDWNVPGTVSYTPTNVLTQTGVAAITVNVGGTDGGAVVTFPVAFSAKPLIICSLIDPGMYPLGFDSISVIAYMVEADDFQIRVLCQPGAPPSSGEVFHVAWLAIGPRA